MPLPPPLPAITPEFLQGLRDTVAASDDSMTKRFIEKLGANGEKGDKNLTSFFNRLKNALEKKKPVERILYGYERKLLSDADKEYTEASIRILEEQAKLEPLDSREQFSLDMLESHEPIIDYQRHYHRRAALGLGIQAVGVALAPLLVGANLAEDERKHQNDIKKHGERGRRNMIQQAYYKTTSVGTGVLQTLLVLLAGDAVKEDGPAPSVVWRTKGWQLMDGLNQMLTQAKKEIDKEPGMGTP